MSNETKEGDLGSCGVCGTFEELFELPGKADRCCICCSADLATVALLTEEIDSATFGGRDAEGLVEELNAVGARMLARSQSADFGSISI